jgi:ABC-type oligopeptide transport system substrate-binding subunit
VTEVDGERSSVRMPHQFLTDRLVREAYNVAVDRRTIAEQLYGAASQPPATSLTALSVFSRPTPTGRSISNKRDNGWSKLGGNVAATASGSKTVAG